MGLSIDQQQIQMLTDQLTEARQTIAELTQRQHRDSVLDEADTLHRAAARLITDRMIVEIHPDDLSLIITELRGAHPNLLCGSNHPRRDLHRYLKQQRESFSQDVPF